MQPSKFTKLFGRSLSYVYVLPQVYDHPDTNAQVKHLSDGFSSVKRNHRSFQQSSCLPRRPEVKNRAFVFASKIQETRTPSSGQILQTCACQSVCMSTIRSLSTVSASSLFTKGREDTPQSPVQINLDLETKLSDSNIHTLQQNLKARGLDLDLNQLVIDYRKWKEVDLIKRTLETEKSDIAKIMAALVTQKSASSEGKGREELMKRGKEVREQLRKITPSCWAAEEKVVLQALQLPTELHPQTPDKNQIVDYFNGTTPTSANRISHIKLGEEIGLLKFSNVGPRAVYLFGELAELEQLLLQYVTTKMDQRGFSPIKCPEIFRAVVVEGCGINPNCTDEIFTLYTRKVEEEVLGSSHLKGNSLLSFGAFFAKVQTKDDHLPVKMYSFGCHYKPQNDCSLPGLYGAVQSDRVTMFSAAASGDIITAVHSDMVAAAWEIAKELGLPARKMLICANQLSPSESLRTEIQVWAPGLQQFVQMAYASIHNDYVSNRLMSRTLAEGRPLHMASGVVMDTKVLLASILEHSYSQGQYKLMDMPCLRNLTLS